MSPRAILAILATLALTAPADAGMQVAGHGVAIIIVPAPAARFDPWVQRVLVQRQIRRWTGPAPVCFPPSPNPEDALVELRPLWPEPLEGQPGGR